MSNRTVTGRKAQTRKYTPDECVARLRVIASCDGVSDNGTRVDSARRMLGTLTVKALVGVCDTLHALDGYSTRQLSRMTKGTLITRLLAELTQAGRAIARNEV